MIDNHTLIEVVAHSNRIEGEPTSGDSFDRHLRAARACIIAAEEGTLVHPRAIHSMAFDGMYGHAGQYREVEVYVNTPTGKRMFPPHNSVPQLMCDWWDMRHLDPWPTHVSFESIHPFEDGNGRVGRMFMWMQEVCFGQPITIIRYEDRFDYYSKLEAARASNNS